MEMNKAPIRKNPQLLDALFADIQRGLVAKFGWLDKAFGRAERLVRYSAQKKKIYTPNVFAGGNEYIDVTPDANIGNFSFFWVDDPQNVDAERNVNISINTGFSLIVWVDIRKVYNDRKERNKELLKREILDALNGGIWIKDGRVEITKVWELAENVYRGFTLDEIDNQFMMQPYCGFRFEGKLRITESC